MNNIGEGCLLLNFTGTPINHKTIKNYGYEAEDYISYSFVSDKPSIDLYKTVPSKLSATNKSIIYYVNDLEQIINNKIWFESRKGKNDVIIDKNGHITSIN